MGTHERKTWNHDEFSSGFAAILDPLAPQQMDQLRVFGGIGFEGALRRNARNVVSLDSHLDDASALTMLINSL